MIVYHGSNHNFKKLKLDSKLTRDSTKQNEGVGIYFSKKPDVASSYGKYLYTLCVNDKYLLDFSNIETCKKFVISMIAEVYKMYKIDIRMLLCVDTLANEIYDGRACIYTFDEEVMLHLDSNEYFYRRCNENAVNLVRRALHSYKNRVLKCYLFNYNIPEIGVIKDVSDDIVRIIDKNKIC